MSLEYIQFGNKNNQDSHYALRFERTKQILEALHKNVDFEFIETRSLNEIGEVIIVDYTNSSIKSRNKIGIKNRERFAIAYLVNEKNPLHVFPLRKEFPDVLHLNNYFKGLPRSLCLYIEPWAEIEREFTPERFLKRIGWWLVEASNNTLHADDQPLEQLYFYSKFEIIIPQNFNDDSKDKNKTLYKKKIVHNKDLDTHTIEVDFRDKFINDRHCNYLCLTLPPVKHAAVNYHPESLGELQDQFVNLGSDLIGSLREEFKRVVSEHGILNAVEDEYSILILTVPRLDNNGKITDRKDVCAFLIVCQLGTLGESMGVLIRGENGIFYNETPIFAKEIYKDDWREFLVKPIHVAHSLTKEFARTVSDVNIQTSDFSGVLVGAGALGSSIAELWAKSAWGEWLVIDCDEVRIHNVIRHIANLSDIGMSKSVLIAERMNKNFEDGYTKNSSLFIEVSIENSNKWLPIFSKSDFIVDATATTGVSRDFSSQNNLPRCCSVFITPSGFGGILWIEDSIRKIRLDYLELLYYRAIVNETWGEKFLAKDRQDLRVGAGCSDISNVISYEQIKLYSSLMARQLRIYKDKSEAGLKVWEMDDNSGEVFVHTIRIFNPISRTLGEWQILCDDWLIRKLKVNRSNNLPNETGGILVGYIDQKLKKIYIVDCINAPPDSKSSSMEFIRGVEGLSEIVSVIRNRTNSNLDYIGEWHSHPKNANALPSSVDLQQMTDFTKIMSQEGLPLLMLIVGEKEISYSLGIDNLSETYYEIGLSEILD